ncbi:MAG: thiamine pyrophosphate-dependent enzyme [Chloroflexota bacterium]|nr:thiamine pyrophosphate-dependent enzyme [Chloroflexota bacterium]
MSNRVLVSGTPTQWVRRPGGNIQCAGCHHPSVERLICEVVEELEIADKTIAISGVGCSTRFTVPVDLDGLVTAHGRAPDAATGIKRVHPDAMVFTVQGDGDCIAIGAGPLIGAVSRAERITVIMVNNANFGTTGGQMAPTSLMGQVTETTPQGRSASTGYPMHVPELLATVKGVAYCARCTVHTPANYQRTKKYVKSAFQKQLDNVGFSFVEILAACPPNWRMSPIQCLKWIEETMIPEFPLGEFKNVDKIE